jgi:outer membrane translocation and assembly module TamA
MPFKIGQLFDAQIFDQSKKDVKLLYANQGYCNMELEAKAWIDLETDSAYLVYDATPNELCYFGAIEIFPPDNIDSRIIKSLLYIKEEEPFSPELISRSYKSLYGHEGISKAIIDTSVQDTNRSLVSVTVTANEKPVRFQAGIGASSDEGIMFSIGVKHRNLFGNLKTLSVNTRITEIKKTVKSNFDMPLTNRNITGAEIGYEDEKFLGFKEKRVFGSVYLSQREIINVFKESILFDHSTTYDSEDEVLFPEAKLFVTSPKLEWTYDTRDNLLDPTQGYLLRLELMGSILSDISDASYSKYKLSGAYIIPFLPSVVALKIDFGSLHLYDGDIPASYRFYSGGMNSNRAYGYRKLGPTNDNGNPTGFNSILEMTAEYRFPICGKFRGVVFNDNTFIGEGSYPDYNKGYYSAGVGLRYVTPIGPIAIDFGFDIENPLNQYAIHFHIGELY